jgi:hypothetical protein
MDIATHAHIVMQLLWCLCQDIAHPHEEGILEEETVEEEDGKILNYLKSLNLEKS